MTSGLRTSQGTPIVAVPAREKKVVTIPKKKEKPIINLDKPLPLTQVVPELKGTPKPTEKPKEPEYIPPHVEVGTVVIHKMFGEGEVTWIKENKYVYVKFTAMGGKTFQYSEAFKQGFLKVKE